jgi:hypothetical protein
MKTSRVLFFAATSVLLSSVIPLSAWGAAPKVNGLFYGDGDTNNYPVVPYASSVNDSKLYVTYINGTLYVALVVNRTISAC